MNAVTLTVALAPILTIAALVMAYKLRKINNARDNELKKIIR